MSRWTPADEARLCRAFGTHAWRVAGPVVVLSASKRRVALQCARCASWRYDIWSTSGAIEGRGYDLQATYKDYLKDHKRDGARTDILSSSKEVQHEADHPRLRLLQGGRRGGRQRKTDARAKAKRA